MLGKFFTSNWFAVPIVVLAFTSVALLYLTERTTEALCGAVLLGVAIILILLGREKKNQDTDEP